MLKQKPKLILALVFAYFIWLKKSSKRDLQALRSLTVKKKNPLSGRQVGKLEINSQNFLTIPPATLGSHR
jgi:hypothetical protein